MNKLLTKLNVTRDTGKRAVTGHGDKRDTVTKEEIQTLFAAQLQIGASGHIRG